MQRNNDAYKYRILGMILQGEETLALSKEERGLFKFITLPETKEGIVIRIRGEKGRAVYSLAPNNSLTSKCTK